MQVLNYSDEDNNETNEELLVQRHQLHQGEWAKGEREAVVKLFWARQKILESQAEVARELSKLAKVMEPRLFEELLIQSATAPVKIQIA